jgi:hypothetical protein
MCLSQQQYRLVFVMGTDCVLWEVENEFLCAIKMMRRNCLLEHVIEGKL